MEEPYCEVKSFPTLWDRKHGVCCGFFFAVGVSAEGGGEGNPRVRPHTHSAINSFASIKEKVSPHETQFANNEHLLCLELARQSILVRDWTRATAGTVLSSPF